MKKPCSLIFLLIFFVSCEQEKAPEDFLFEKLPEETTGLNFSNNLTETNALNILDYLYFYNGGGVAVGDINNDGLPDIYLTGNQVNNKLFLNKGKMQFEDITEKAGVSGESDWNTGVVMADVNADGFLDIYVCAVSGINGLNGINELFINNGDGTFTEKAEEFGLDFKNYSSTAAFFDFDNDGDLDMYLLNHAVHTVNTYGPADIRNKRIAESGDKLLRNDNGKFIDISEEAGIYGGANGYGLGLATADFNNDGFTDIYVSNDFHEDDYYYLNNGNGTFTETLKSKFGHVSRFSMGNDAADVNNDGFIDMLSLDMLPQDEKVLKASVSDDPRDLDKLKTEELGYHYQYARNMLQINQQGEYFQETGLLSGIAATDWSWAPLFADFDQDGFQDLYIATGIPKRPNDLDYIKYVSSNQIQKKINNTRLVDNEALEMMPSGKVHNYVFKGSASLNFTDQSGKWMARDSVISTGIAYGDLDNDGDLDIVSNNINANANIYENQSDSTSAYLKLSFNLKDKNTFGIGTKAIAWQDGKMQTRQLYNSKGFQSSSEPIIHFGFPKQEKLDSLLIIWPDNTFQKEFQLEINQHLEISQNQNLEEIDYKKLFPAPSPWFEKIDSLGGINFNHKENRYTDFDRQKLIPYQISDRGPAVAVGDLNADGLDDIYFGNSKFEPAEIYFQQKNTFKKQDFQLLKEDEKTENTSAFITDLNQDNKNELFVTSGGGEFYGEADALLDKIYSVENGELTAKELPQYFENTSVVKVSDLDGDGDLDIFVGGAAVSNDFGKLPSSYLLFNENGKFRIQKNPELEKAGMVTDAIWTDFDEDGLDDLIVIGEWMSPKFFRNNNGTLENTTAKMLDKELNGLWQTIIPFDINNDGKMDYLLGNWGLNTKFPASKEFPLKMYYSDFDKNGSTETIIAYAKNQKYYPANGLDELVGQLSYLRKKFPEYKDFAGKTIEDIFEKEVLQKAKLLKVHTMASGYLLNQDGKFIFNRFQNALQVAPILAFLKADFNKDNQDEVLVAGNYFGITPYHGRFDGMAGNMITQNGEILESVELGINLTQKSVRSLDLINFKGIDYLMVSLNNGKPEFYKLKK
ncbi:VCBS repeat-containing protein [Salegentibacter salegens]|uniref:Repeat domain-containing protein n=1 Tax=Salegentibacter salegens TaxID=143223 RepID=A0A1M7JUB2_9FLAO|nr:VCBS repeat-containing protein [Salegentibacter salegens]PRX51939.1 VCBS repeat protein [Salegentibacter salegens]SHM56564.1 Repeat domain-containing protein [Salegentibacter salegens]